MGAVGRHQFLALTQQLPGQLWQARFAGAAVHGHDRQLGLLELQRLGQMHVGTRSHDIGENL